MIRQNKPSHLLLSFCLLCLEGSILLELSLLPKAFSAQYSQVAALFSKLQRLHIAFINSDFISQLFKHETPILIGQKMLQSRGSSHFIYHGASYITDI